MSEYYSINSSEDRPCHVDNFNEHKSIILLKNESDNDGLLLKNININLNHMANKKEYLIVLWRLLLNPTSSAPTWLPVHANAGSEYSLENKSVTIAPTTEVLISGYISSTMTLNVDTLLSNKIIAIGDIVALTIEYVGSNSVTQNTSVSALGSISWAEGVPIASGSEAALIAAATAITDAATSIETSAADMSTAATDITTAASNITTAATTVNDAGVSIGISATAMTAAAGAMSTAATTMTAAADAIIAAHP